MKTNRVLVSIVSEQTIPNYIFIKQMYQKGDGLIFISSKKMQVKIEPIVNALHYEDCSVIPIIFEKDNDEERWHSLSKQIEKYLDKGVKYVVNLTGGTKYLSLATQKLFENYNSDFYYIPYPKNYLLSPKFEDDVPILIDKRVSVSEYMSLYNLKTKNKQINISKEYTQKFFNFFVTGFLYPDDFSIIDSLRVYRNKRNIRIDDIENLKTDEIVKGKKEQIKGLKDFLTKIEFNTTIEGQLSKYEIQYITGGWFEEYVFHLISEYIKPDDIQIGVEILRTVSTNMNDLDIVFTLGNKLFVIECKTGGINKQSLFNQIVYKASALKEYLLGLSARSYIFSLSDEDKELTDTAKNMGINYIDRTYFTVQEKTVQLMNDIKKEAY